MAPRVTTASLHTWNTGVPMMGAITSTSTNAALATGIVTSNLTENGSSSDACHDVSDVVVTAINGVGLKGEKCHYALMSVM